jgi:tripartite-type tricarboxylate transporter receptor subunit TctC
MKSVIGLVAFALLVAAPQVQGAEDFYQGKTIKMIIGASPQGGYADHSRVLSRHMPKHIPGSPTIVVQNMPAAGGMAATNHIFNVALKDGTEMGLFNRNTTLSGLIGIEQAKYKIQEFNWLGTTASYSDNAHLFIIKSSLPHKTADDLRNEKMAPISVGNSGSALVRVLKEALDFNMKIIEGYQGNDLDPAFERGEIDGHAINYLTMMTHAPHWMQQGIARPMVQFGRADRLPILASVPTARELIKDEAKLSLMLMTEAPLQMGYPFALPPGVPADRVAIMRKAFKATMEDPEYRAEIGKVGLELTPKYDADILAILDRLAKSPPSAMKRYQELLVN